MKEKNEDKRGLAAKKKNSGESTQNKINDTE
jgi:hypothetical protein